MGKVMYLVTHGDRGYGVDPGLTETGIDQMLAIQLPEDIPLVVVGTGSRFEGVFHGTGAAKLEIPVKASPFCGSADSLNADKETVTLADGRVFKLSDYEGLDSTPGFDAWTFVASHPDRTLFCAGGELMLALGQKSEKGCLYELDVEAKTAKKIQ